MFDTTKGEVVREIVTEANKKNKIHCAFGITWVEGTLLVTDGRYVFRVDPKTGEIHSTTALEDIVLGLAWDGKNVLTVSSRWSKNPIPSVLLLDPKTFKITGRVEMNYGLGALDVYRSEHIVSERLTFGHDANHKSIQVGPDKFFIYRMKLKPDAVEKLR